MNIIPYDEKYAEQITDLFYNTIHAVAAKDYTPKQLGAWSGLKGQYDSWKKRLDIKKPFIALNNQTVVGFAELDQDTIDCFYVHKDYQRQGVGRLLMKTILDQAQMNQVKKLTVRVSLTAKSFFDTMGFQLLEDVVIERSGQQLKCFMMKKTLR